MDFKKLLLPLFALMVCLQLYVPAKMIWDREDVIEMGTIYKFRTAPVDPSDPFRGKFVQLRFSDNDVNMFEEVGANHLKKGEEVYVSFTLDEFGYAKPNAPQREQIQDTDAYLKLSVYSSKKNVVRLNYPFDRFYMEESKAYPVEELYRGIARDTSRSTYAVVSIKDGLGVLLDVEVDGVSVRELVEENLNN